MKFEWLQLLRPASVALALALGLNANTAVATTTGNYVGTFSGNDQCPSPGGNKTAVAAMSGAFCLAKFANGNQATGEMGTNALLSGVNLLDNFKLSGTSGNSGTFGFDDQGEGFAIKYIVLKAGPEFAVFDLLGATSGSWMTAPYLLGGGGSGRSISHISFYGDVAAAVPLPLGAVLLVSGFGLAGLFSFTRRSPETAA